MRLIKQGITMKKTFDVNKVNNHFEALAIHLGASTERSAIEQRFTGGEVHHYLHNGQSYFVANSEYGLAGDALIELNGQTWSVLAEKKNSPYERFSDNKVFAKIDSILEEGCKLLAVNQAEGKVLLKRRCGGLNIQSYTSHLPNDISSYYLGGDIGGTLFDVSTVFTNYKLSDNAVMI